MHSCVDNLAFSMLMLIVLVIKFVIGLFIIFVQILNFMLRVLHVIFNNFNFKRYPLKNICLNFLS